MGMRSQIYVRFNKKLVVTNYYHWNYGEIMISRARYGIEYIKDALLEHKEWIFNDECQMRKLSRIFDANFDMKDISISQNIIKEWKEQFPEDDFNNYVFRFQDNNDGRLFIDILDDGTIKYAFLDSNCNTDNIMNARQYMDWDSGDWKHDEYIEDEQKELCEQNLIEIDNMAQLMTKEEVEDFINYNYVEDMKNLLF